MSNAAGVVVERMAYDPCGKRRFPNGSDDRQDSLYGVSTDCGYTMHEHLDEMGIIHMNGRVYDPLNGRFMSSDPIIQEPGNLQSYNRYAYVFNNPLLFTDPSGYSAWTKFRDRVLKPVAFAYIGYLTGGLAMNAIIPSSMGVAGGGLLAVGGAVGGFTAGALSTETFKGAVQGAFTGALFGAAGSVGIADSGARYLAHAGAGCVSAVAGGGNCGQGAASAVFGKFTTNQIGGVGANAPVGEVIAKGIATAVAGGVGSIMAGGRFENGATTAAFGYLFNQMMSMQCTSDARKCTGTVSEDRLFYTGKTKESWFSVDWDGPTVVKVELSSLVPNVANKFPGFELSVSITNQGGELLHEARVDKQHYSVTIMDQIEVSRVPGNSLTGNTYRWVSAPGRNDVISRKQIQSCVSVICAQWRN